MLQEGYDKFHGSLFRIPTFTSWYIVVPDRSMIEEMCRAPDDVLSASEASRDLYHTDLTLGDEQFDDPFHVEAVRGPLTRNIGAKFDEVHDEIVAAFRDHIPINGDEWKGITAYPTMLDIVCRTSNRMLVGLPLCRDPDWLDLSNRFTMDLFMSFLVFSLVPGILRPSVVPFLRSIRNGIDRGIKHLGPLIQERREQEARHGKDYSDKPNDLITWFFDVTKDRERDISTIAREALVINFAAIHTTTMAFTYVLFELATRPEYVKPLRDEVEAVVGEEGWSRDSISKLRKVDSFIKESLRVSHFVLVTMVRKTLKDFTFSNGTTIPAGNTLCIPYHTVHTATDNYVNPEIFDGYRFEKMRESGDKSGKLQLINLDPTFVLFGHGRHACPGRFFVATELKAMLAHVLLNYDIKMADGRGRPNNRQFGINCAPDVTAQVLFRKRSEVGEM